MKNNPQLNALANMPGFRKVIPKEVFFMKLKQKNEALILTLASNEQTRPDVVAMNHLYEMMCTLNRNALRAQQKMFIATYSTPFLFYENFVKLLLISPFSEKPVAPHLRLVRSS